MTIRLGGVGVIDVQQIVVVAHGEHDVTSLEAKAAAHVDVETIGVSVIGIVVVVSLVFINMDGADIDSPVIGGTGQNATLENGAGEEAESEITAEFEGIGQIHGDVEGELGITLGNGTADKGTASGIIVRVQQHVCIETGSYTQTGYDGNVVAATQIETVVRDGICFGIAGGSGFRSEQVTGAGSELGVGLGTDEHQGCCKKSCKNLFHNMEFLWFPWLQR